MQETSPSADNNKLHRVTVKRRYAGAPDRDSSTALYLSKPEELPALYKQFCESYLGIREMVTVSKDGKDITDYVFDREWEGGEGDTAGSPGSQE